MLDHGATGRDFFVVLAGAVKVMCPTPVGAVRVGDLRTGALVGEVSHLDGKPRPASVITTQDTELLRFPSGRVRDLLRTDVAVRVALLRSFWHALAVKIRLANRAMATLMSGNPSLPRRGDGGAGQRVSMAPAAKVELFREQGLSAAELRLLASTLPARRYAGDQVIFSEGQNADALFVVVDGAVRISRRFGDTGEEAIAILAPGEAFGEMALIDDQRRSADAIAHTEGCTLLVVSKSDFQDIVDVRSPGSAQFMELFCSVLSRRLREMLELLVKWRILAGAFGSEG